MKPKKRPADEEGLNQDGEKRSRTNGLDEDEDVPDENHGTPNEPVPRVSKLEFVTQPARLADESLPRPLKHNINNLEADLDRLRKKIKNQGDLARYQAASFDLPGLESEIEEMEQEKDETKAGKTRLKKAKQFLSKTKSAIARSLFDKDKREAEHGLESEAQHALEDFLYYQESTRRWKRRRMIDPVGRSAEEAERRKRKMAYMVDENDGTYHYYDWLHALLELYDARGVGNSDYKQGRTDWMGNSNLGAGNTVQPPVVGPKELHLWTPIWRRRPFGLPKRINVHKETGGGGLDEPEDEMFEYELPNDDEARQGSDIRLDLKAIERRRATVERKKVTDHQGGKLTYATHTERRQLEMTAYENTRPSTSYIRVRTTPDGALIEDGWRNLRTEQGLFIAAKESSRDWLTSYDCLGKVRPGWIPDIMPQLSDVRDEPPSESEDDDYIRTRDYPSEDDKDLEEIPENAGDLGQTSKPETPSPKKGAKVSKNGKNNEPKKSFVALEPMPGQEPVPEAEQLPTGGEVPKKKAKDQSWRKRRANINYPYKKREFKQEHTDPDINRESEHQVTPWAEQTDGRREWHVYQQLSPFSACDSPPHVPIRPGVIEEVDPDSIPHATDTSDPWDVVSSTDMDLLEPRQRRCEHNPERCRAWWRHLTTECWIADSEATRLPDVPAGDDDAIQKHPMKINMLSQLIIPESGVEIYRARLHDHYGVVPDGDFRWPKRGIRIPYAPMTFDDMKLNPSDDTEMGGDYAREKSGAGVTMVDNPKKPDEDESTRGFVAKDVASRVAHEFHSMAVPIIKTPQNDWGEVGAEGPPAARGSGGGRGGDDEESDDEGDLFRISYEDGSRAAGARVPGSPPELTEPIEEFPADDLL